MTLTVELPNDIADHEDATGEALEAFAVQAYCADVLTRHQAADLLRISRYDFEGILKRRGIMKDAYDVEALEQDIRTGDALRKAERIPR